MKTPGERMFNALYPCGLHHIRHGWQSWTEISPRQREIFEKDAVAIYTAVAPFYAAETKKDPPSGEVVIGRARVLGMTRTPDFRYGEKIQAQTVLDVSGVVVDKHVPADAWAGYHDGSVEFLLVARPNADKIRERISALDVERDALLRRLPR